MNRWERFDGRAVAHLIVNADTSGRTAYGKRPTKTMIVAICGRTGEPSHDHEAKRCEKCLAVLEHHLTESRKRNAAKEAA